MNTIMVGVMNSSKEITETLEDVLRDEGFHTCSTFTHILKEHEKKFDEFISNYEPSVIIYDIAIPYEQNYELFKRLYKRPSAKGVSFLLTTTNKVVLESLVGAIGAYEIVGKPYDLAELVKAVKKAYKNTLKSQD